MFFTCIFFIFEVKNEKIKKLKKKKYYEFE